MYIAICIGSGKYNVQRVVITHRSVRAFIWTVQTNPVWLLIIIVETK